METLYQSPHDIGMAELKRDVVFRKIPPEQYDELISFAWGKGEKAARDYTEKLGTSIPSEMAKKLGIHVAWKNWTPGKSNVRVYSEYEDNSETITLYENIIRSGIKKAVEHGYDRIKTFSAAKELFIAHEIYHQLECRHLGLASKERKVVTLKIGPLQRTSGLRSLCEIGAHAFSKTLMEDNHDYEELEAAAEDR